MASFAGAAEFPPESAQPVQAIWKTQQIRFHYQSFTTFYSCGALENKLEQLLRVLGAAQVHVKVRSTDCPWGPVQMPLVVVDVTSPVEATAQALAERDKDRSTRELAARVTGKQRELAKELEPFAAQWKPVSLSRGRRDLDPGDCELIDELRRKVLPKLAVRITADNLQCVPRKLTRGQPQLQVEALIKIPEPDEAQKGVDR